MKIVKYIPDTITSGNLLCGTLGIVFAVSGRIDIAFPLMLLGSVFDFCDGLAARALGAYSDLGKELDSLADMVSFGVLPSVMLYNMMRELTFSESWPCFVPLLIAVFSGIRLAKFNVDERQHDSFLGLATPACALLCASCAYYVAFEPASVIATLCALPWFVPVMSVVLCALLVCEIPMFSFKFGKGQPDALKWKRISFLSEAVIIAVLVLVFGYNWSLAVVLIMLLYILKNVFYKIFSV